MSRRFVSRCRRRKPFPARKLCPGSPELPCQNQNPVKPCYKKVLDTASLPRIGHKAPCDCKLEANMAQFPALKTPGRYHTVVHVAIRGNRSLTTRIGRGESGWLCALTAPREPIVAARRSNGQQSDDFKTPNHLARKHLRQEIDSPSDSAKYKSVPHNNLQHLGRPRNAVRGHYLPQRYSSLSHCQTRTCIH